MATKPTRDAQSEYDRNSNLAEAFGWVLLAGLAVELVFAFALDKPLLERYSTIVEDLLIVGGVWGEIHFGRRARSAGDRLQIDATARVAEAEARGKEALQRAAEANFRARVATIDLVRIKTPRRLSDERIPAFVQAMRPYEDLGAGSLRGVTVGASPANWEAVTFADQLVKVLRQAGIMANRNDEAARVQVGVVGGVGARFVTGNEKGEAFATELANALTGELIPAIAVGGLLGPVAAQAKNEGRINDVDFEWVVVVVGDKV